MKKVADLILVDGTTTRLPTTVAKMELEAIQAAVGGYVEHARGPQRTDLWCNENGIALGLPHNLWASLLTGFHVLGNAIVEYWE